MTYDRFRIFRRHFLTRHLPGWPYKQTSSQTLLTEQIHLEKLYSLPVSIGRGEWGDYEGPVCCRIDFIYLYTNYLGQHALTFALAKRAGTKGGGALDLLYSFLLLAPKREPLDLHSDLTLLWNNALVTCLTVTSGM